mgnify:CR=1 FL=1
MDKKMKVRIGIGAAIAVAAVLLMLSGKKKGQQGPMGMGQEAVATIVKAQKPSVGDISLTTGLTGTVEPSDVVYVYAKASGDVTSVLVKAGDMVEQGQAIGVIVTGQGEVTVEASLTGLLRGIIKDGYPVVKGFKIADIDPRKSEYENCFTISDKARCIAGSVVEGLQMLEVKQGY